MNNLIENLETEQPSESVDLATVASVNEDGISLIFDGEETASEKHYKGNAQAVLKEGDRVKVTKSSGTYVIDYKLGIPSSGGGSTDGNLPAGGTTGQMLVKTSDNDYEVSWSDSHGIPSGGTKGYVLMKSSASDYSVDWSVIYQVPTGGSKGQVLTKTGTAPTAYEWADAESTSTPNTIANGNYKITMGATGVLAPTSTTYRISLGSSSYPIKDFYASGNINLANTTSTATVKIGHTTYTTLSFFNATGATRQTVSNSATVATLITALKKYGLIY